MDAKPGLEPSTSQPASNAMAEHAPPAEAAAEGTPQGAADLAEEPRRLPFPVAQKLDASLNVRERQVLGLMGRVRAADLMDDGARCLVSGPLAKKASDISAVEKQRDLEEVLARVEKSSPSGAFLFGSPVNAEAMGVPDYYTHVRKPMWLGRIREQIVGGAYEHVGRFAADVRTMFRVCEIFNGPASFAVRSTGATMHGEFMTQWAVRVLQWRLEEDDSCFPPPDEDLVSPERLALYRVAMRTVYDVQGTRLWVGGPAVGCSRCRHSDRGCRFCLEALISSCRDYSINVPAWLQLLATRFDNCRALLSTMEGQLDPVPPGAKAWVPSRGYEGRLSKALRRQLNRDEGHESDRRDADGDGTSQGMGSADGGGFLGDGRGPEVNTRNAGDVGRGREPDGGVAANGELWGRPPGSSLGPIPVPPGVAWSSGAGGGGVPRLKLSREAAALLRGSNAGASREGTPRKRPASHAEEDAEGVTRSLRSRARREVDGAEAGAALVESAGPGIETGMDKLLGAAMFEEDAALGRARNEAGAAVAEAMAAAVRAQEDWAAATRTLLASSAALENQLRSELRVRREERDAARQQLHEVWRHQSALQARAEAAEAELEAANQRVAELQRQVQDLRQQLGGAGRNGVGSSHEASAANGMPKVRLTGLRT